MYLTYEEYTNMGGTLDETAFEQFEWEARTKVDWYTFNRLQNEETYPEAVKRCVFKLISLLQAQDSAMGTSAVNAEDASVTSQIASYSNDGVSVSYNTLSAKETLEAADNAVKRCVNEYLQGVVNSLGQKVLYRGIYPNE